LSSKINFETLWNLEYVSKMKNTIIHNILNFKTLQVTEESILLFYNGYISFIENYELLRQHLNINTNIELPELDILIDGYKSCLEYDESSDEITNGYNIVFSGVRSKEKEQEFENKGYTISDAVNSKTKLLIVKDLNVNSSKIKKAKALKVQIVSLDSLSIL